MRINNRVISFLMIIIFGELLISCNSVSSKSGSSPVEDITIINDLKLELKGGFDATKITPEVPDTWTDKNNDAKYRKKDGDTFTDGNGNGKFDPVWIAGFGNKRAASGIHDDLWARTLVIDDGKVRLAIVSLDVIGFMNNCVNDVRDILSEEAGITYLIVTSTHSHEGPDLLGLWGKSFLKSGVNKEYLEYVKIQIAKSVESAAKNIVPVSLEISEDNHGAATMVGDTRNPQVFDSGLRIIRVIDKKNGKTIGTLSEWGDHPETLWGKNLLISSDFPHFFREAIENGLMTGDSTNYEGTGGISVYVSGALGGLMTTSPGLAIKDPLTGDEFREPSFEKARAQGRNLALLALKAMSEPKEIIDSASISIVVRNLRLPLDNKLFKIGKILGVLDRERASLSEMSTELAVVKIGPVSFVTFPGEVYPEIINGGIEAPEGNDFGIDPVEVPSIRDAMPGKYKFVLGMANDEIGYIIPKSEWDKKSPYTYGRDKAPYGEENSIGPETAPLLHSRLIEMLSRFN